MIEYGSLVLRDDRQYGSSLPAKELNGTWIAISRSGTKLPLSYYITDLTEDKAERIP